jgi:hypothetical protein
MRKRVAKAVEKYLLEVQVEAILLHHAFNLKTLVTYRDLALTLGGIPHGQQLASALQAINEDCWKDKKPPLAALVVRADTSFPGAGFFQQCRELGWKIGPTAKDERDWWATQVHRIGAEPYTQAQWIQSQLETLQDAELVSNVGDFHEGQTAHRHLVVGPIGTARQHSPSDLQDLDAALGGSEPDPLPDLPADLWSGMGTPLACSGRPANLPGFHKVSAPGFTAGYIPATQARPGDIWERRKGQALYPPAGKARPEKVLEDTDYQILDVRTNPAIPHWVSLKILNLTNREISAVTFDTLYHMRVRSQQSLAPLATPSVQVPDWVKQACRTQWETWPLQRQALLSGNEGVLGFFVGQVLRATNEIITPDTLEQIAQEFQQLT